VTSRIICRVHYVLVHELLKCTACFRKNDATTISTVSRYKSALWLAIYDAFTKSAYNICDGKVRACTGTVQYYSSPQKKLWGDILPFFRILFPQMD
jgi:hypothetical protein